MKHIIPNKHFRLDTMRYAIEPSDKHQKRLDTPCSMTLIAADEWMAPTKNFPANSSFDTLKELETMAFQTKQFGETAQAKYMKKYDEEFFKPFKKICKEHGLEFNQTYFSDLIEEAGEIVIKLKYRFNRPRPYQLAPIVGIDINHEPTRTAKTPSFPSGHSCQGHLIANVLSKKYPQCAKEFKDVAEKISFSRYIGGLHFPSDLEYGKELANWMMNYVVTPTQVNESEEIVNEEDERLHKIRHFKGSVEDYRQYWENRIKENES